MAEEVDHALRVRRIKATRFVVVLVGKSGSAAEAVDVVEAMDGAAWCRLAAMTGHGDPSLETREMVRRALVFRAALEDLMGPMARAVFE